MNQSYSPRVHASGIPKTKDSMAVEVEVAERIKHQRMAIRISGFCFANPWRDWCLGFPT